MNNLVRPKRSPDRRSRRRAILIRRVWALLALCAVIVILVLLVRACSSNDDGAGSTSTTVPATSSSDDDEAGSTSTTVPTLNMKVAPTAQTAPAAFNFTTDIFQGTTKLSSYSRPQPIRFGPGKDYTSLPGIITFRGNNYREGASYGTATVTTGTLETLWKVPTGSVRKSGGKGAWTGSGWTGQPLIVKWPDDIKKIMNISPEKKADPDLVEVIYPCLDGKVYFLDLKDGTPTRPAIKTGGGPTKGTASLYPNGIPMLFMGQGDALPASREGAVKYRIYSLIDQKLMYTFGTNDPVAHRRWQAYDASALVDVETDTLIEPGENGLLYTIKLNTKFDKTAGTLSIDPEQAIKFRYTTPEYRDGSSNTPSTRWWGMEASPAAWRQYLYVSDNGGKLMCIDLNTMRLVWAQNILDDSNSSPLFEESIEDGTAYIYTSTSLRITAKGKAPRTGDIPVWKINAATGEIVWTAGPYKCYTISGVSGGVEGTGVLGKHDIADLVIYPIARTPNVNSGILVALDKATGAERWRFAMDNYAWSSPVAVYTDTGKSYIVICDSQGNVFLLEGKTGRLLSTLSTTEGGSPIEASPAVYENTIVIGTRAQSIFGITIK